MPHHCSVPGCRSYYASKKEQKSVFTFPLKEPERLELWKRCINRENFEPTKHSVVCIQHFDERFVIREDKFDRGDGTVLIVPRKRPKLKKDAYPTIFPRSVKNYRTRRKVSEEDEEIKNFRKTRERKVSEEEEEITIKYEPLEEEIEMKEEIITDFEELKKICEEKQMNDFLKVGDEKKIVFYKMNIDDVPTITRSLVIHENFKVCIYNQGVVCNRKLISILGSDFLLDTWSKFENLVTFFQQF